MSAGARRPATVAHMTTVKDKVVALTGAASGIGCALAHLLASKGASLALADVNETGLRETAKTLPGTGERSTHVVDVRNREAVYRYAEDVERRHGRADIVINNAGLTVKGSIEDVSYEDFELVIGVNMWGVIHGVRAFLPLLRKRPEGHIVNISSINAMVPFVDNGPYNISKYAVLGLSETLMMELAESPIRVTCVHPGGVRTNIARSAKGISAQEAAFFDRIARTMPDQAAAQIVRGIEKNREQIFVGRDAKTMAAAKRIAPHWVIHRAGAIALRLRRQGFR
jgi:NAD(P)-dependent dehydrogenase (short-subunit alcohol dehydrogenase family)